MAHSGRPSSFICVPKLLRAEHSQGALTALDRAHAWRLGTRRAAAVAARRPPGPASAGGRARAWRPAPPPAACCRRATARGTAGPVCAQSAGAMPWRRRLCRRPSALGWVRAASGGACKRCLERSRTAFQAAAPPRSAAPHARARAPRGARRRRAPPSSPCSVRAHLERAAACPAGELRAHALRSDLGRGGGAAGPQYTVQQHLLLQRAGACPKAPRHRMRGRCRPTGWCCRCQGDVRLCSSDGPGSGGCLHAWPLPLCRAWWASKPCSPLMGEGKPPCVKYRSRVVQRLHATVDL